MIAIFQKNYSKTKSFFLIMIKEIKPKLNFLTEVLKIQL